MEKKKIQCDYGDVLKHMEEKAEIYNDTEKEEMIIEELMDY